MLFMDDTAPNTHHFIAAAPVHDVPPDTFASAASQGAALYLAVFVSFALMGLLYREIRNLRLIAEDLARRCSTTALDIASITTPANHSSADEVSQ